MNSDWLVVVTLNDCRSCLDFMGTFPFDSLQRLGPRAFASEIRISIRPRHPSGARAIH